MRLYWHGYPETYEQFLNHTGEDCLLHMEALDEVIDQSNTPPPKDMR